MSVGVAVGEEVRVGGEGVGGAGVGGAGELVAKGGGERDRPQAAMDAANTRNANKALAACTITKVFSVVGYP